MNAVAKVQYDKLSQRIGPKANFLCRSPSVNAVSSSLSDRPEADDARMSLFPHLAIYTVADVEKKRCLGIKRARQSFKYGVSSSLFVNLGH